MTAEIIKATAFAPSYIDRAHEMNGVHSISDVVSVDTIRKFCTIPFAFDIDCIITMLRQMAP